MEHRGFAFGLEFCTAAGRWRCTDVGTRTIAAIRLNKDDDPAWYAGPPYAVVEQVFDEYDIEGCEPAVPRDSPEFRLDRSGRRTSRSSRAGTSASASGSQ